MHGLQYDIFSIHCIIICTTYFSMIVHVPKVSHHTFRICTPYIVHTPHTTTRAEESLNFNVFYSFVDNNKANISNLSLVCIAPDVSAPETQYNMKPSDKPTHQPYQSPPIVLRENLQRSSSLPSSTSTTSASASAVSTSIFSLLDRERILCLRRSDSAKRPT